VNENNKIDIKDPKFLLNRMLGLIDEILAAIIISAVVAYWKVILSNILLVIITFGIIAALLFLKKYHRAKPWFQPVALTLICMFIIFIVAKIISLIFKLHLADWQIFLISLSGIIITVVFYFIRYLSREKGITERIKTIERPRDWKYIIIAAVVILLLFAWIKRENRILYDQIKKSVIEDLKDFDNIVTLNNEIYFYFEPFFLENQLFDKVYGFHKLAEYLAEPDYLSQFLHKYITEDSQLKKYYEILEVEQAQGIKRNAVALFASAYWECAHELLLFSGNYIRKTKSQSIITIPVNKLREKISRRAVNVEQLYRPQLTLITDYTDALAQVDVAILGNKKKLLRYLADGTKTELKKFVNVANSDACTGFLFANLIAKDNASHHFLANGFSSEDFNILLAPYSFSPEIHAEVGEVPIIRLRHSDENTLYCTVPMPITIREYTQNKFYLENAVRAFLGDLLQEMPRDQFYLIVKPLSLTHMGLFVSWLESLKREFQNNNDDFEYVELEKMELSDSHTLCYRIIAKSAHEKCKKLNAMNTLREKFNSELNNNITMNSETNNLYTTENTIKQVILVIPKVRNFSF